MKEQGINLACKEWLEKQGYKYKGVLNSGKGEVEVPDGERNVLIDHQGVKDRDVDLLWVEAKGESVGLSMLLQGFIRVLYACYWGAGKGLLAVDRKNYGILMKQEAFLTAVKIASGREIGILNVENDVVKWL